MIQYALTKLRYNSLPQLALDVLKALRIRIHPFYVFREGLTAQAMKASPVPGEFEIRLLTAEDLPSLLDFPDRNYPLEQLQKRLEGGGVGVAAWSDGRPIGCSWANLTHFSYRGYEFPLHQNEAYLYDLYTAAEYRGKGLARHLREQLYRAMAERGRTTLFSTTERFNPPALRLKQKVGARIVDTGLLVNIFGLWSHLPRTHPEKVRGPVSDRSG